MGRPTALTPDVQQRIVDAIRGGNYQETAAAAGGISDRSLYGWMQRGRLEDERVADGRRPRTSEAPFLQFFHAVTRARAETEARNVAQLERSAGGGAVLERRTITRADGTTEVIEKLAPPDWRANAWWLERSFPKKWGRSDPMRAMEVDSGGVKPADLLEQAKERRLHLAGGTATG